MKLSKRALGFLSRKYRSIINLSQSGLSSTLLVTSLVTAGLVLGVAPCFVPTDALAAMTSSTAVETVDDDKNSHTVSTVISKVDATDYYAGVYAPQGSDANPTDIKITVDKTDSITITSLEGNSKFISLYGIYANRSTKNEIINNGKITITAKALIPSTSSFASSRAYAYGMYAEGTSAINELINSGTIIVTASSTSDTAGAYGMYVVGSDNNLTNKGIITASNIDGRAYTYGMYVSGDTNTLINEKGGIMTVTASSTSGNANARGMYAEGTSNELINKGTITASSTDGNADAHGMYAEGTSNELTNEGTIAVTASNTSDSTSGSGSAYGMYAISEGAKNELTNSGAITAKASSANSDASAYGMWAGGVGTVITNKGNITVTALNSNSFTAANAYGMYVKDGTSTLNNYGIITVSARAESGNTKAYQAYVENGTANIGTWTLKLGETYGTDYRVFGVENGTLNFGVDGKGATIIVSGVGDAFVSGTEYAISDMVDIVDGTVDGYIETVTSSYAFLEVELIDKGTVDDSYTDQYIKGALSTSADNSPAQAAANHSIGGMKSNMSQMRNIVEGQTRGAGDRLGKQGTQNETQSPTATMYADAGTVISDASFVPDATFLRPVAPVWKTFLTPYYSQNGANNGSYDGHMYGVAMGATCQISSDFALGAHFGLSKGSSDSALTDTDATSYTLGAHAVYNVGESLFFRGQLSGFMSENDLTMLGSSAGLTRANTDMDTTGLYAMIGAGYDIALNDNHILTPELGLSYFYAHMDGFDADFYDTVSGSKDASLGMASESYDVWYADATLRWTGIFDMDKGTLRPTVKAGIRQALSDPDVSSTMRFGTVSATTYSDANETSFLCEAGFSWEYDAITLSATYSGEFGNVEYSHMGTLKAEWKF